ncbi:ATP-binding cassette domain-containing protein [Microbacterium sp. KUDC0406]|uniref:ATP-binding cassette domain-containing protein n=1 Tax=Microbacterium sp. KUDC0406 TaxID=2909588 RepID=UPI001F3482FE|nr:ATP-binding cassette domain-containing protein [Microbacterium sp. KUDC0406]UJP09832.1 ATP-binding cassette domain-containing protein [Microbacterium sp. KUDC0406]
MTAVLSLDRVSKSFGAAHALIDVDLGINAGEVLAVVGDNGAGKSTLMAVASGAVAPDSGTVRVDGASTRFRSPADARRLGIVASPQSLALCGNLDVVENLYLGHEEVGGFVLDEVRMEHDARVVLDSLAARIPDVRVPVQALSGGQRRSVAIARTLLGEPRVILLDEPTNGLGVRQTAQILTLIGRLRARGHAVVLASHSITDVLAVADRVVVLRLGHLVAEYDTAEVTAEELLGAITGATAVRPSGASREAGL